MGAQAALSAVFGAMTEWQPAQLFSHTALPSAAMADPAASAAASAPTIKSNGLFI
jgi:hypothetical protein